MSELKLPEFKLNEEVYFVTVGLFDHKPYQYGYGTIRMIQPEYSYEEIVGYTYIIFYGDRGESTKYVFRTEEETIKFMKDSYNKD